MAHFYGTLQGSRGQATRCGTVNSGMVTTAASWRGAVHVRLYHDDGVDRYEVTGIPWHGSGDSFVIASGVIGDAGRIIK